MKAQDKQQEAIELETLIDKVVNLWPELLHDRREDGTIRLLTKTWLLTRAEGTQHIESRIRDYCDEKGIRIQNFGHAHATALYHVCIGTNCHGYGPTRVIATLRALLEQFNIEVPKMLPNSIDTTTTDRDTLMNIAQKLLNQGQDVMAYNLQKIATHISISEVQQAENEVLASTEAIMARATKPEAAKVGPDVNDSVAKAANDLDSFYVDWVDALGESNSPMERIIARLRALADAKPMMPDKLVELCQWAECQGGYAASLVASIRSHYTEKVA